MSFSTEDKGAGMDLRLSVSCVSIHYETPNGHNGSLEREEPHEQYAGGEAGKVCRQIGA